MQRDSSMIFSMQASTVCYEHVRLISRYLRERFGLRYNGFAILLWPVSFTFPNMLRACNDVRFTMGISVFSMFLFRIGLSLIIAVHFGLGAIGVWIAMIVDWIFRSICFIIRYLHGKWRITGYLVKTQ